MVGPDDGNKLADVAGTAEGSGLQLVLDDAIVSGLSEGAKLEIVVGSLRGVDDGLDDGVRHGAEASSKLGAAIGMPLGARLGTEESSTLRSSCCFPDISWPN